MAQDRLISEPGKNIKEELNSAIQAEEAKLKSLTTERERLRETAGAKEKQMQMWNDVLS